MLYFFLFGLELMGSSFKLLSGRTAADTFKSVDNPVMGLMVGIFAVSNDYVCTRHTLVGALL